MNNRSQIDKSRLVLQYEMFAPSKHYFCHCVAAVGRKVRGQESSLEGQASTGRLTVGDDLAADGLSNRKRIRSLHDISDI